MKSNLKNKAVMWAAVGCVRAVQALASQKQGLGPSNHQAKFPHAPHLGGNLCY